MADDKGNDTPQDESSVKVVVRVRPQLAKERIDMCQVCTRVTPDEPQIFLGKDKAFTFDVVFDMAATQEDIYDKTAKSLIEGTFDGYNATIFAYGQTGSGKTFTMGTGFELDGEPGIIPRAVGHLFDGIEERRRKATESGEPPPEFKVNAHFMELYNEEILDLFDTTRDPSERNRKSHIRIHEDACGGIYCVGVTTRPVSTLEETLQCLKMGALSRTTGSTNMNATSSRSHAIFTLHIKQHRIIKEQPLVEDGKEQDTTELSTEFETLTAKFHFVDLAGSERLKRTGATGDRAKEGISINCGLLALGNVISALGDRSKKASHVPYRDSKLTRLLQDSLGGNSRTMMIACISPSDRDFMETLNSLKYANRAKNIRNRVTVNQDKTSRQLAGLRQDILALTQELNEYKSGKRLLDADGVETVNDMFHENSMLQAENTSLRQRIKALTTTLDSLRDRNSQLLAQRDMANIPTDTPGDVEKLIQGYIHEIEDLRCKLMESESVCEALKRRASVTPSRLSMSPGRSMTASVAADDNQHIQELLDVAKRDLVNSKKTLESSQYSQSSDKSKPSSENEVESGEEENEGEEEEEADDMDMEDEDEELDLKDSDSEGEDNATAAVSSSNGQLHEDLADLQCEISIKQKLIDELELSQKRLHAMKSQYEGKLSALQHRIRETELERDKVLNNLGSIENQQSEAVKKEKVKWEKKLTEMNGDLKKLQAAKKEHSKLLRNKSHYEKQLGTMQKDLTDLKRLKVKLMNQIKVESNKSREAELRRRREVGLLKKDQAAKDNKIRGLQTEKRQRDLVLKRKQEEVKVLRQRQQKPLSSRAAGRVTPASKPFSARAAKAKWDTIQRSMSAIVVKKQTLSHMERDMERWLKQRDSLTKKVERVHRRQEAALAQGNADHAKELGEQLDTLRSNIAFAQDNINECQSNIMSMEETKNDEQEPQTLFNKTNSLEEAKYLLEHFLNMVINKGLTAAQKDAENKELLAKLHQERMDTTFQRDMLQYLIADKVDIDFDESVLTSHADDSDSDSENDSSSPSTRSSSPIDSRLLFAGDAANLPALLKSPVDIVRLLPGAAGAMSASHHSTATAGAAGAGAGGPPSSEDSLTASNTSISRKDKARRKTATPMEMLGGTTEAMPLSLVPEHPKRPQTLPSDHKQQQQTQRTHAGNEHTTQRPPASGGGSSNSTSANKLMPPPPPPKPRHVRPDSAGAVRSDPSPNLSRKRYTAEPSPSMRRKAGGSAAPTPTTSTGSLSRQTSSNAVTPSEDGSTPPTSPSSMRRSRDENVFSRLTSQTAPASPHPSRRKKSLENPGPTEAKGERGSQILWRLWLERRQGRKRNHNKSDQDEDNTQASGTSLESGLSPTQQAKDTGGLDNGVSQPKNGSEAASQNHVDGTVKPRSMQSSYEDSLPSDEATCTSLIQDDDDDDVFERLSVPKISRGVINAAQGRSLKQSPLVHSHTAVGHHKAVLSVFATEDLMFSSSKDRTAKVWDLVSGEEILTLDGHPNNVVSVRYSPDTSLVYTVSTYFCKVFDIRAGNTCIRTLLSSGLTEDGSIQSDPSLRQVSCPPGETVINDIALNSSGSVLYTAAGNNVRIWDLRSYRAVGKLSGGHQAAVMVLAVDDTDTADGNICVVTGSKDHYIKVFDVDEDSVGVLTPKYNLEPPHYDGIQSLCLMGDLLFSGSRDTCIKKWDLSQQQLQQSMNNAHKDWVCGLSFLPGGNCLLSGCRSGYVKLWHIDNCNLLGEIKAHNNPINSITTNSTCIFTASNDRSIRIWRARGGFEASDTSDLE